MPFLFKPFKTLFWSLPPFSLGVPLDILVRKGRRGRSSARISILTPFVSNIKMGGEQHNSSFLISLQVFMYQLIFALVILHHVSCPGINKLKNENLNKREEYCYLMTFFWFLTYHIISLWPFFSLHTKDSAFLVSHFSETKKIWLSFPSAFSCYVSCHKGERK